MSVVGMVPRTVRSEAPAGGWRAWIARCFTAVEDTVYIGLGLLLAGSPLLTALIVGLVVSLALLRRRADRPLADRAT